MDRSKNKLNGVSDYAHSVKFSNVKFAGGGGMPWIQIDAPLIKGDENCPVCGRQLYKYDLKNLRQDGRYVFHQCRNKNCPLYEVTLQLNQFHNLTKLEIKNYHERMQRIKEQHGLKGDESLYLYNRSLNKHNSGKTYKAYKKHITPDSVEIHHLVDERGIILSNKAGVIVTVGGRIFVYMVDSDSTPIVVKTNNLLGYDLVLEKIVNWS